MEILKARDEFTPLAVQIRSTLAARKTAVGAANGGYYTTTVVPQAQRLLETAVGQYNVMQLGVFQLLQARDRKIRASLEYVTALSTYWKERAACANPRRQTARRDRKDRSHPDHIGRAECIREPAMKMTRREAVAASGAAIVGAALGSGSALAQMNHEGHRMPMPQAMPPAQNNAGAAPQWIDIAKGTKHPARTIEPGEAQPPGEPGTRLQSCHHA